MNRRQRPPGSAWRTPRLARLFLRACLSVRFQGLTSPPEYQPSAPSRLRPAKRAALCLPDPCGLGSDSHDGKVFSGKLLKSLTQTGSECPRGTALTFSLGPIGAEGDQRANKKPPPMGGISPIA